MNGTSRTDRLEQNRERFTLAKHTGPLLAFSELTPTEQGFLTSEFLINSRSITKGDVETLGTCYVQTMHGWGVMCPHPMPHRLYEGKWQTEVHLDFELSPWFDCGLCKTRVINRGT